MMLVGTISKGHADYFMWSMLSSKVDKEMHSKWVSKAEGSEEIPRTLVSGETCSLIPTILFIKRLRNSSHLHWRLLIAD